MNTPSKKTLEDVDTLTSDIIERTFQSTDLNKLPSHEELKELEASHNARSSVLFASDNMWPEDMFDVREKYRRFSYATITKDIIDGLVDIVLSGKYKRVLEVCAGKGHLSKWLAIALKDHNIPVIATDNFSWKRLNNGRLPHVRNEDAIETVKDSYPTDLIILSWPHFNEKVASNVYKAMKPNQTLIYIGEGWWGCCAEDEFFELVNDNITETDIKYYQFYGLHDNIYIVTKPKDKE